MPPIPWMGSTSPSSGTRPDQECSLLWIHGTSPRLEQAAQPYAPATRMSVDSDRHSSLYILAFPEPPRNIHLLLVCVCTAQRSLRPVPGSTGTSSLSTVDSKSSFVTPVRKLRHPDSCVSVSSLDASALQGRERGRMDEGSGESFAVYVEHEFTRVRSSYSTSAWHSNSKMLRVGGVQPGQVDANPSLHRNQSELWL